MKYDSIFNSYLTTEGVPFTLKSRSIKFPEDMSLEIYDKIYVSGNIPWTILSYQIYNTIDYWWILATLNSKYVFYAPEGEEIHYIKPEYIDNIISAIEQNA